MVIRTTEHTERFDITYFMFKSTINRLVKKILQSNIKYEAIYAIPRGGLILGVYLSHILKLPMLSGRSLIKKNTLIVDDICDTGLTLSKFKNNNKVVIVTKSAGLDTCPDLMYAYGVANHIWVRFPWEVDDV